MNRMNGINQKQFENAIRNFSPSQVLEQIANNPHAMQNELVRNVINMRNNHDTNGLNTLGENIFKENGMNFGEYTNQLKQQLGYK